MAQEIPMPPERNINGGSHNQKRVESVTSYPASPGSPATGSVGTPKGADERGMPVSGPLGKRNPNPQESSFR